MTFRDFYKPPFRSDGYFIWSSNDEMALMISEDKDDSVRLLNRVCDILNDNTRSNKVPELSYVAPEIFMNGKSFLTIRGWGSLIHKASNEEEAAKIQDDFAHWVITKLQQV